MIEFELGDARVPRGHAIVYFRATIGDGIAACYLIVPPILIDLSRYVPPMFAGQVPIATLREVQAIPLPPIPERVSSWTYLERLARHRGDDLVFGGTLNLDDVPAALAASSEAAQRYLAIYRLAIDAVRLELTDSVAPGDSDTPSLAVDDVLYDLLGDHDRLMELAKLVGKLRYAVDGGDRALGDDTVAQMRRLVRNMPEKYRVVDLIEAAQRTGLAGQRLAELHVDRCFKLAVEDYRAVADLDRQIDSVRGQA